MNIPDRPSEKRPELHRHLSRLPIITRRQRVVVEGDAIHDGDQQQRPVGAAFSLGHVAAVVDGQEYVRRAGEVRKGFAQGVRVGGLQDHERHAWPEEDNIRVFILYQELTLQIPRLIQLGDARQESW